MSEWLTIKELERIRNIEENEKKIMEEKQFFRENFKGSSIEFLASGGEGRIYLRTDKFGNKSIIKCYSIELEKLSKKLGNKLESFDTIIKNLKEQQKIIKKVGELMAQKTVLALDQVPIEIIEYMDGDLENMKFEDDYDRFVVATKVAHIICEIHRKHIVHGDLKPENFLIKSGNIKLTDLGLSSNYVVKGIEYSVKGGTAGFIDPNLLGKQKATGEELFSADIYALATTLYLIITGDNTFVNKKQDEKLEQLRIDKSKSKNDPVMLKFFELMEQMIDPDLNKRLEAEEVLNIITRLCISKKLQKTGQCYLSDKEKVKNGFKYFYLKAQEKINSNKLSTPFLNETFLTMGKVFQHNDIHTDDLPQLTLTEKENRDLNNLEECMKTLDLFITQCQLGEARENMINDVNNIVPNTLSV